MEVLTFERGWILIGDLTLNDKIASLKDNTFLEYIQPLSIEKVKYNGPIYKVKHQYVDLMVTPDKMLFVQKSKTFKQKPFDFVRASSLLHQLLRVLTLKRKLIMNLNIIFIIVNYMFS